MYRHSGLASRTRRRRLIAINSLLQQSEAEVEAAPSMPPPSDELSDLNPFPTTIDALSHIANLLSGSQPRTWAFAGDSLGWNPAEAKRSYSEYFTDVLRVKYQRQEDVIIDLLTADSSIVSLLSNFEWRFKKFQPDVVFWMPGLTDVSRGQAGLRIFTDKLRELAFYLKEHDALLVIATPPLNLAAAHAPYRDLPAYIIVIREMAEEMGLLLVDHWKYWHVARKTKPIEEWTGSQGTRILQEGHRRMARFLLRTVGISID